MINKEVWSKSFFVLEKKLFQKLRMSAREIYEPTTDPESAMYGPFFGTLGVSAAMMFTAAGSACGTAKSGTGIASMAVTRPDLVMKAIIPVVMAGIVAIYGLVVAVVYAGRVTSSADGFKIDQGFSMFAGGLVCGLCGCGAGYAIGIAGDAGVRALSQQPRFFIGMILILIFAEVLGLYGMIIALVLGAT
ncbi:Uncharacterized protein BM_BM5332 [Brugia malayi]|uniref:V-type proton ATPase proteolipid subunit n=5 Tax=Onchocercidae TaxID=6296 RepID=A0A4E9F5I7_BRUMA|nr:Uncharacterized protein BM_BM5332 [Brugia malayi]VIO91376.1 Uncharacterized protein BM_BM5332 [Brugia malayi]